MYSIVTIVDVSSLTRLRYFGPGGQFKLLRKKAWLFSDTPFQSTYESNNNDLYWAYPSPVTEARGQCGSGSFITHERITRNHLTRASSEVGSLSHPSPMSCYTLHLYILSADCRISFLVKHTEEALGHSNQKGMMGCQIRNEGSQFYIL